MPFLVFVSYARSDRDEYLERFVSDLEDEVRRKSRERLPAKHVAFVDTTAIETGAEWEQELALALRTSRVCICLCSSAYLNSEYCGKEFQVFCDRRASAVHRPQGASPRSRAILPLVWEHPSGTLPLALARLQYTDDDFPSVYAMEGLRYMMKLSRYKDDYLEFVDRLATKVVQAGTESPLPEFASLPPLATIVNPFRPSSQRGVEPTEFIQAGPNGARFVFVAATKQEMQSQRRSLDCYSDYGGWYWKPFTPGTNEPIGKFAQATATHLDLRYNELQFTSELISELEEANARHEVVVLIVDPWTLHLDEYCSIMRDFDRFSLINCAVLVPWNSADEETATARPLLYQRLRHAFFQKIRLESSPHHRDTLHSAADLQKTLAEMITRIRMMILQRDEPERIASDPELLQRAREQGIPTVAKPTIRGPAA